MDTTTLATAPPTPATQPKSSTEVAPEPIKRISIICSKGSLDMAYPGLILANAARMNGIEATIFFTFWGLDVITKKKVDHLHLQVMGNTSMPMPTWIAGFPGMESVATAMMKKELERLDIPPIHEFLTILKDSGAKLYACALAMDMFQLAKADLVDEVEDVISAGEFYEKSAGAQIIFI